MPLMARKTFVFNGKQLVAGTFLADDLLDKYQRETFLRTGFVVERALPTQPVVKKKAAAKMTEVKADELVV